MRIKKIILIRILLIVLICVNLAFIFYNSAQDGVKSGTTSKKIATDTAPIVNWDYNNKTKSEQKAFVNKYNLVLRKVAHFSEFVPLGFLSLFLISTFIDKKYKWRLPVSLGGSLAFGCICGFIDEYHQKFVDGRGGMATDALIDTSGVLFGCILALALIFVARKISDKGKKQNGREHNDI